MRLPIKFILFSSLFLFSCKKNGTTTLVEPTLNVLSQTQWSSAINDLSFLEINHLTNLYFNYLNDSIVSLKATIHEQGFLPVEQSLNVYYTFKSGKLTFFRITNIENISPEILQINTKLSSAPNGWVQTLNTQNRIVFETEFSEVEGGNKAILVKERLYE